MINKEKFLGILEGMLANFVKEKYQYFDSNDGESKIHKAGFVTSAIVIKQFCEAVLFPALEVMVKEINKNEKNKEDKNE